MTMKVYQTDSGQTVITGDDNLVKRAEAINQSADYWEYVDGAGNTVRVDVSAHRPDLDVLAGLYGKADASKRPEDAAAYVRHRNRIIEMFRKRDVAGERYE